MNPFSNPPRIMVQSRPQDMRAGIQRLATIVEAELGCSPSDGTLWCFVSRDRRKAKMLRCDSGAWCLWYVRLAEGSIRWERDAAGSPVNVKDFFLGKVGTFSQAAVRSSSGLPVTSSSRPTVSTFFLAR